MSKVEIDYIGNKHWYNSKKQLHRKNGPAIEAVNGYRAYYNNNKLHRNNGPAVTWPNGSRQYYLNGRSLVPEEFRLLTGKVVKYFGKKYKLVEVEE